MDGLSDPVGDEARTTLDEAARRSHGRLVALLCASSRDIALAEDCVAEAYASAAQSWPTRGVPDNPDGWLLTVARNRMRDTLRSAAHRLQRPIPDALADEMPADDEVGGLPDRRLELMLACAHPAVDPAIRSPLMLNTVLGIPAEHIARVWAVSPAAMAQRLVRAKRRIRDAGIPFRVPEPEELQERLPGLLEAVYGAFSVDWHSVEDPVRDDRAASEAAFLAQTLARLVDDPEALGLASLTAFCLARVPARRQGGYTPLSAQDPATWDSGLIALGEQLLHRAAKHRRPGRFQLEAAIQSAHCERARTGTTDWGAICSLYDALVALTPTWGAHVARAAAVASRDGADAGLRELDALPTEARDFQPAWAVRAHLLEAAGRTDAAEAAYRKAESLCEHPAVRVYLAGRRVALTTPTRP